MLYQIRDPRALTRRHLVVFALVAFVIAAMSVPYFSGQPGYTDAFYHYNGAASLARGAGFVDAYLWTYQGAPDTLPAPSHLYWMPGTSLLAALGMVLFGVSYAAAQSVLVLCVWGAALLAYALGAAVGGTGRHAWAAGLLTLSGGFFLRMYGVTDTFAPYAFFGAAALLAQGIARMRQRLWLWAAAGALAAAGHLIRSDGLLLVIVGVGAALWPVRSTQENTHFAEGQQAGAWGGGRTRSSLGKGTRTWHALSLLAFVGTYGLVMLPWFARNLAAVGTILPTGGTQAVWYLTYDDLFNYPPRPDALAFTAEGVQALIQARVDAFVPILQTFIAIEGMIVLTPLMLLALWKRRKQALFQPFIVFVMGIHVAFWLVFPFPGVRGGLFHAASALIPWWTALGVIGVDDAVRWIARQRKHWQPRTAARLFTIMLVLGVAWLSWTLSAPNRFGAYTLPLYPALEAALPDGARVMINDPSQLYYYTGHGGVVLPNEPPQTILEIATVYDIDYVVIEGDAVNGLAVPAPMIFDLDAPPPFLREVSHEVFQRPDARLYEIVRENS